SLEIRKRVQRVRDIQLNRFSGREGIFCNAQMESRDVNLYCRLDAKSSDLLKMAMSKLGLSARAYDKILKLSRTIADLDGKDHIRPEHVSEAIQYRSLDRHLWI
ncbi:MAG: magnesium chelatase, partial [Fidelibacterota bacterium]